MSNRGKPMLSKLDSDRCEALTVMTEWKQRNKREERCPFMAKYVLQGHQFCMHHTRVEAIAICVEKGLLTRLMAPPPTFGGRTRIAKKEGK